MEDLIAEIKQGNTARFHEVVVRFQQLIFRYSYRLLGNREDAEDVTQEVFLKAYRHLEQYRENTSFSSWLYKIAYHVCLNKIRRRSIYERLKRLLFYPMDTTETAVPVDQQPFSESLAIALQRLSAAERNLIVLRIFEEKTFEQMGEIMGCSTEAAKKRYQRVKEKLKRWLQEKEDESNAARLFYTR